MKGTSMFKTGVVYQIDFLELITLSIAYMSKEGLN